MKHSIAVFISIIILLSLSCKISKEFDSKGRIIFERKRFFVWDTPNTIQYEYSDSCNLELKIKTARKTVTFYQYKCNSLSLDTIEVHNRKEKINTVYKVEQDGSLTKIRTYKTIAKF